MIAQQANGMAQTSPSFVAGNASAGLVNDGWIEVVLPKRMASW
jgi:hypothetical protein